MKKKFKINGMHCTSCAINIDFDLEELDGVKFAKTSYVKQEIEVEYEPDKITEGAILSTIKNTGYTALPLETNT